MGIEWVFLDVGGVIFRDDAYFTALYESIAEAAPAVTHAAYDARLTKLRAAQNEPFSEALLSTFVADPSLHNGVRAAADALWEERGHRLGELYPEVPAVLRNLVDRYRLACITNHFGWVRDRFADAGLVALISAWAISAEAGVEKPDPAIFAFALDEAGTTADRAAMVGDRLDRDIAPAKALGMRTVWVLRNEAPDEPTAAQLAVPDATIRSLGELPETLDRF